MRKRFPRAPKGSRWPSTYTRTSRPLPFRLRDFFSNWGQTFNSRNILGNRADAKHHITMKVEGRPSRAFGDLRLRDGQRIVINYQ